MIPNRNENGRSNPIIQANSLDKIKFKVEKIQSRLGQLVSANITSNVTNVEKTTFNFESVVFDAKRKVRRKALDYLSVRGSLRMGFIRTWFLFSILVHKWCFAIWSAKNCYSWYHCAAKWRQPEIRVWLFHW